MLKEKKILTHLEEEEVEVEVRCAWARVRRL